MVTGQFAQGQFASGGDGINTWEGIGSQSADRSIFLLVCIFINVSKLNY